MSKAVVNILLEAEELLQQRRQKEAIEKLGEVEVASISPDDRALYYLIFADASISLGNYNIKNELQEAVEYYRLSDENIRFAQAKYLQGLLLAYEGGYFSAKEVLLEAYMNFKRCRYPGGQALVLNWLSFACFNLGDLEGSANYLEQCVKIYEEMQDFYKSSIVSTNLAQLYYSRGLLDKSIKLYSDISDNVPEWDAQNAAVYYMQSAIPYALRGDFGRAHAQIKKTIPYLKNFPRENAIYFENLGWIYLLENEYDIAKKTLLDGLAIANRIAPESALVSQIKRRLGDACLELADYKNSKEWVDQALELAKKINERAEIAACHRTLAQMECTFGNLQKAQERFQKAIGLFQMIGFKYELALTRYLAGMSGQYNEGERQALLFLAREYFESEHVHHIVKEINTCINQTPATTPQFRSPKQNAPVIIAVDAKMHRLIELAENVAASEMSVLLMGATGTGKDIFARYIHDISGRKGRFVAVNSAAIPDSMIEAELFGHRKGSFTGAGHDKKGLIEVAAGGTLYLNEIAESTEEFQTKLLDVLEHKKIRRLGETSERRVDFRLIAATNHDLGKSIQQGKFRADLYHRINEVFLELPPLCERRDDIDVLTSHFLLLSGVRVNDHEPDFERLVRYFRTCAWPGNVRQLQSEIRRLALLSKGDLSQIADSAAGQKPNERDRLLGLLHETGWNRREVARRMQVSEATIRRRIRQLRLSPPEK